MGFTCNVYTYIQWSLDNSNFKGGKNLFDLCIFRVTKYRIERIRIP